MTAHRAIRSWLLVALAVLAAACGGSDPAPRRPTTTTEPPQRAVTELSPTSTSIGDPMAPELGNSGYDVESYDLSIEWKPKTERAKITAVIEATATQPLDEFTLDFANFAIQSLTVDGQEADSELRGSKFTITPATPIAEGAPFVTEIRYVGQPAMQRSELARHQVGWEITESGTVYAVGDPDGTHLWAPVNDHPLDRAYWTIEISAPTPLFGIASGDMTNRIQGPETTTTEWATSDPIGPHAVTIAIREASLVDTTSAGVGVDIRSLLPPSMVDRPPAVVGRIGEMIDFLEQRLGPFPYDSYGIAVVDGTPPPLPANTWSILSESQLDGSQAELRVVADLARHWFGDSATPRTWSEVWLSTSVPLYASWMWLEKESGTKAIGVVARAARSEVKDSAWPAPDDPVAGDIYGTATFIYGAVYLHALRLKIGDRAFFDLLRSLHADHRGGVVTTSDLITETYKASGQDLRFYIDAWFGADPLPGFPDA